MGRTNPRGYEYDGKKIIAPEPEQLGQNTPHRHIIEQNIKILPRLRPSEAAVPAFLVSL